MEKSILKNHLKKIRPDSSGRFHMPGHKGRIKNTSAYDLDLTEIPGADNLHDPHGIIGQVQEKMATIFGSQQAAILINGSTTGIQSAILAACQPGDELLVPLNCHRSVFAALALGRIQGRFISPSLDKEWGFARELRLSDLETACRLYPQAKGMVLVNPTYYGTVSDIQAITAFLHDQGKFLIVDEAHGAQFYFSSVFPQTALAAGADLVIQSTHKVLGSLGQTSLIHGQGSLLDWSRVRLFLGLLQSSSPSYPLMVSVEEAVDRSLEKGQAVFEAIKKRHLQFCKKKRGQETIELYDGSKDPHGYDYTKWLFLSHGPSGSELERRLRTDFGIQCEMSDHHSVLAMCGLETTLTDLDDLTQAIDRLNGQLGPRGEKPCPPQEPKEDMTLGLPLWQALWSDKKEKMTLTAAKNRIVGDFIIPYPPGIPILLPGSRLTQDKLSRLEQMLASGATVVGIDQKNQLLVVGEDENGN